MLRIWLLLWLWDGWVERERENLVVDEVDWKTDGKIVFVRCDDSSPTPSVSIVVLCLGEIDVMLIALVRIRSDSQRRAQ
jgi:hypothetical protein